VSPGATASAAAAAAAAAAIAAAAAAAAAAQRKHVRELYVTIGKVMSQLLREGLQLPESFASPLLMWFLFDGEQGIAGCPLSYQELETAVLAFDSSFDATLRYFRSEDFTRRRLVDEFVMPAIISPRLPALLAMREGFSIVPIATHLAFFSSQEFRESFVALEVRCCQSASRCLCVRTHTHTH
jgi:hypothetical protein